MIHCTGCPANEENNEGLTPQKLAKQEGLKDAMKELKKLTALQDKIARGTKPKGAAEPWAVQVSLRRKTNMRGGGGGEREEGREGEEEGRKGGREWRGEGEEGREVEVEIKREEGEGGGGGEGEGQVENAERVNK